MSLFLSPADIEELTERKTATAQVKVLREMGYDVSWVKGQRPKVSMAHFMRKSGGIATPRQKQEVKMDFSQL